MAWNKLMTRPRDQASLLLAVIMFCIASVFLFDRPVAYFFSGPLGTPWYPSWDTFWSVITLAGESSWYLVSGPACALIFWHSNRHASLSGIFLFVTVAVSGLAADLLKAIFGRARPILLFSDGVYRFTGFQVETLFEKYWTSFPSGHSATALSTALTLSILFPRFRWLFSAAGVMVAFSRIVLCEHYLSDVIAGSYLGAITVFFLYNRYFEQPLHASSRS